MAKDPLVDAPSTARQPSRVGRVLVPGLVTVGINVAVPVATFSSRSPFVSYYWLPITAGVLVLSLVAALVALAVRRVEGVGILTGVVIAAAVQVMGLVLMLDGISS